MGHVWELVLPANQTLVLLALADHADHEGNNVFPSIGLIAWKTGYSERQVQRIVKQLVKDKILVETKRPGFTTLYKIDLTAGVKKELYNPRQDVTPDTAMSPHPRHNDVTPTPDTAMSPEPSVDPSLNREGAPKVEMPSHPSKEVGTAIFDGKAPEPLTPSAARPPSPLPLNYARLQADTGQKHPIITAYESAFEENPPLNTERNAKHQQLAHTLARQGYTPEQVTACVRSKLRTGKSDYAFSWLAQDLPAFVRGQKPAKVPTTSPAPVENITPMTAEEWAAAVNSPEFKALRLKVAQ